MLVAEMNRLVTALSLDRDKEEFETVIQTVENGVRFGGTNLWILVFAIFIASLGLNVNSTAVVIGAMLVSPLMGPIMGFGMGMAINDVSLLKKAWLNYSLALAIGLGTSTIFFLLTPIKGASAEILARTAPNVYDVLIALFGGFAGILAISTKQKGNVVPGVAIATALMPPLCTAGYGLANWNLSYLSGALYLFIINTVFISLATLVTARFLRFPRKQLESAHDEVVSARIVGGIAILTLLPSIYFAYDIVMQNRFRQKANDFISKEATFPNDYLLNKTIDAKKQTISLTYGGDLITPDNIGYLKSKLPAYGLENGELEIRQGFALLSGSTETPEDEQALRLTAIIAAKDEELKKTQAAAAAVDAKTGLGRQVSTEIKAQYPSVRSCVVELTSKDPAAETQQSWIAVVTTNPPLPAADRERISNFLKTRLQSDTVSTFFESVPLSSKKQRKGRGVSTRNE